MIKPRVDHLLQNTDSHYAAVVVAARRARQINSYYQSLNEGGYGDYPPPMVPAVPGKGPLTLALEEVAEGKLKYEYRS
ncbi:MAG: DNA-directed RNA polymerase subunit omega [Solirubrobacterales bacterium]